MAVLLRSVADAGSAILALRFLVSPGPFHYTEQDIEFRALSSSRKDMRNSQLAIGCCAFSTSGVTDGRLMLEGNVQKRHQLTLWPPNPAVDE